MLGSLHGENPKDKTVAYLLGHLRNEMEQLDGAERALEAIEKAGGTILA